MKKVTYSIVTALILSVLIALLIPRLLFRGDALWTYQYGTARLDIKFNGHIKKDAWALRALTCGYYNLSGYPTKITKARLS